MFDPGQRGRVDCLLVPLVGFPSGAIPVATTGVPRAKASRRVFDIPSDRLGTAQKFYPLPFACAGGPVVGVTLSDHVLSGVPLTTGRIYFSANTTSRQPMRRK